jgi:hypothetical protein
LAAMSTPPMAILRRGGMLVNWGKLTEGGGCDQVSVSRLRM